MQHYYSTSEDVMKELQTSSAGLSNEDAEKRLQQYGANKLKQAKKEGIVRKFLKQLADPMIIILIVAAAVSALLAVLEGEGGEGFTDVIVIGAVVIINAVLGVVQESKAESAIEALQEMTSPNAKVMRGGILTKIKTEALVPGDIIILEAGDSVPADARLIESASLKSEEAALTGESLPVDKISQALPKSEHVPLGDRKNMVYMGSTVVYGRGIAVVTDTGMNTEMGKIADALSNASEGKTPLQKKLAELSKILTYLVIGISIFIFLFGFFTQENAWNRFLSGEYNILLDSFMVAVSLAVAAIPEGLAAVVTIVLSMGVTKMSKRNAVIRRLTAVETLGCTQIICSDKTGTLTQNKMTVVKEKTANTELLAKCMSLCSDAVLNEANSAEGEPTECALVNYAYTLGMDKRKTEAEMPRVGELPFDSNRKMMSTLHKCGDKYIQFTKGAPDMLLSKCAYYLHNGEVLSLDDKKREEFENENKQMADEALRVLSGAYREYDSNVQLSLEDSENDLVFIGHYGMIDPVRPEVKTAINQCKEAGIRPIMITGDHISTAIAIAKELGVITDASQAITGAELDKYTDEEFAKVVSQYSVYARVQPEHKVKIVNAWRSNGCITAMTGDGVNDAPSIKSADIGIGMGITGTDVTKNVADMVLADDNFATIVSAVEEGRRIYDNIRKAIQFLLSSNLSEIVAIFTATILGFTLLKPIHLLWINLITDCFPALALGMEKGESDVMKRKPRDPKDGIFSGGVGVDVLYQGVMVAVITITAYIIGHYMEAGEWKLVTDSHGMTMAFLTMSLAEILHSFNMRSMRKSVFCVKGHNKFLYGAMILSFLLTAAVVYVPGLNDVFGFEHINLAEFAVSIALAFVVIPLVETVKFIQRKIKSKKGE